MSSESFVANTLFIGPPSSCLSTEVPGRFPFRLPPSVAAGRRNVLRQRADRMRKLSRWAENSKGSIHGPKRVRHGRLRLSPMDLSELKGWAKNPSTSQRVKSLLRSRADSGSLSEWREHGDRENAVFPTPRFDAPNLRRSAAGYTEYETSSLAAPCARFSAVETAPFVLLPRRMATMPVRTISSTP